MVAVGAILFILLILKELRLFDWFIYRLKKLFQKSDPELTTNADMDSDVLAEKQLVKGMSMSEIQRTNLVIVSLTKFYGIDLTVNQLSLAVNA